MIALIICLVIIVSSCTLAVMGIYGLPIHLGIMGITVLIQSIYYMIVSRRY